MQHFLEIGRPRPNDLFTPWHASSPKFLLKIFLYTDNANTFMRNRLFFPFIKFWKWFCKKYESQFLKITDIILRRVHNFGGVSISLPPVDELATEIVPRTIAAIQKKCLFLPSPLPHADLLARIPLWGSV